MSEASRMSLSLRFAALRRIILTLLFAAMLLVPTGPAQARFWVRKLSGVLPEGASVDSLYFNYEISPDSQRVVYIIQNATTGSDDLYSALIHGGTPTRLTLPGFNGREINYVEISPDSSRVVYRADAYINEKDELFSVPIDGTSNPVRISSSVMIADGDVSDFKISPNEARVVYRADQAIDEQENLYSVPIGGGTITQISPSLGANTRVQNYSITPDGQRVVFSTYSEDSLLSQLYFTPIDEYDVKRSDGGPEEGVEDLYFEVLPDNSGVVYSAYQESESAEDVYRADFYSGTTPVTEKLTDAPDLSSILYGFQVTPDGQYAVFAADFTDGSNNEYWRAKIHPGVSIDVARLHPELDEGRGANMGIRITPNGQGAIFVIMEYATSRQIVYSNYLETPLADPYQLSHTPTSDNTGVSSLPIITPNNQGVVFLSNAEDVNTDRLYSNWITGSPLTLISLTPYVVANGDVHGFQITPNSQAVVFRADGLVDEIDELFIIPIGGPWTSTVRISSPMANLAGDVSAYLISPDGKKVVYIADAETEGQNELYVVEDVVLQFLPALSR